MEHRKNKADRRAEEAAGWESIMSEVHKSRKAIDAVDKGLLDMRSIVDRMKQMSTTKG